MAVEIRNSPYLSSFKKQLKHIILLLPSFSATTPCTPYSDSRTEPHDSALSVDQLTMCAL